MTEVIGDDKKLSDKSQIKLSICIPSYNRPDTLVRLLDSIDCKKHIDVVEVIISEDCAPKQEQVRMNVGAYIETSPLMIHYFENEENLGYDRNLRQCVRRASGDWIVYMGDDDQFVSNELDSYIDYLESIGEDVGYVLRSYQVLHANHHVEYMRYYKGNQIFDAGEQTYEELFRKSVFISGFTIRRKWVKDLDTEMFNGTLLYQLYLQAEVCMNHKAVYYDRPITMQVDEESVPYFGSSKAEQHLYTAGTVTLNNSIQFMQQFLKITRYMDEKYDIHSTEYYRKDISKYSYPVLAIQRKRGRKEFREYHGQLKDIGLDQTIYYYIYYCGLLIFGEKFCDAIIRGIKRLCKGTPRLM